MDLTTDVDLDQLIARYGCRAFVETGTGSGKGIEAAAGSSFDQIFSIEAAHKPALDAGLRFAKNHKVTVIHAKAERGLKEVLVELAPSTPTLFRLDAQWQGAATAPMPAERSLRLLAQCRDLSRDVVLIDDLRLYEDGNFEKGPCPPDRLPAPEQRHLRFVEEILGKTHRFERSYQQTGHLCACPKA